MEDKDGGIDIIGHEGVPSLVEARNARRYGNQIRTHMRVRDYVERGGEGNDVLGRVMPMSEATPEREDVIDSEPASGEESREFDDGDAVLGRVMPGESMSEAMPESEAERRERFNEAERELVKERARQLRNERIERIRKRWRKALGICCAITALAFPGGGGTGGEKDEVADAGKKVEPWFNTELASARAEAKSAEEIRLETDESGEEKIVVPAGVAEIPTPEPTSEPTPTSAPTEKLTEAPTSVPNQNKAKSQEKEVEKTYTMEWMKVNRYSHAYDEKGGEHLIPNCEMMKDLRKTENTYYDRKEEKKRKNALGVELEGKTIEQKLERLQQIIASQPEIAADYACALEIKKFKSDEEQYKYAKDLYKLDFEAYKKEVQPIIDELCKRLDGSTIKYKTGYTLRACGKEVSKKKKRYMAYGQLDSSRGLEFIRIERNGKNVLKTGQHEKNKAKSAHVSKNKYGDPAICVSTGGEIWYREGDYVVRLTPKKSEEPKPTPEQSKEPKPTPEQSKEPKPTPVTTPKPKSGEGERAGAENENDQGKVTQTKEVSKKDITEEPKIPPKQEGQSDDKKPNSNPTPQPGSSLTPEELAKMAEDLGGK